MDEGETRDRCLLHIYFILIPFSFAMDASRKEGEDQLDFLEDDDIFEEFEVKGAHAHTLSLFLPHPLPLCS
jgi:hypothetical protein